MTSPFTVRSGRFFEQCLQSAAESCGQAQCCLQFFGRGLNRRGEVA